LKYCVTLDKYKKSFEINNKNNSENNLNDTQLAEEIVEIINSDRSLLSLISTNSIPPFESTNLNEASQ